MLTERRQHILQKLVESYIQTKEPVSSGFLASRFPGKLSSATMRNELAALENDGYVCHPYTSSGSVPTEHAYQTYVEQIQHDAVILPASEEHALRQTAHDADERSGLRMTARALAQVAEETTYVAFTADDVYYTGFTYLFQKPEFLDNRIAAINMSEVLDSIGDAVARIVRMQKTADVEVLISSKNPFGNDCSTVFVRLNRSGIPLLGVVGPMRMPYKKHIMRLAYIQQSFKNHD